MLDFLATKDDRRVAVDVTTKWKAYVPDKTKLARSLRMPLWILHVAPANPKVYHLTLLKPKQVVSRVPMAVFHALHARRTGATSTPGAPTDPSA